MFQILERSPLESAVECGPTLMKQTLRKLFCRAATRARLVAQSFHTLPDLLPL